MFSFFKKKIKPKPAWAPFPTDEMYQLFIQKIEAYFESINVDITVSNDGVVHVEDDSLGLNNLGLHNIAQYCNNQGEHKFEEHIRGHFETLIRGQRFQVKFDTIKKNFAEVKKYLGVRLKSKGELSHAGLENFIHRPIGGGLYSTMIYDLPDTVMTVHPDNLNAWDKDKDDVWAIALQNMENKYPADIYTKELRGISFKTVEADHFFSPKIIFSIHKYKELNGTYGSIVSMPTRHIVIIYPINDRKVLEAITVQIEVTHGVSAKGPGTLSNNIYWVDEGIIENLAYQIVDSKLRFTPSQSFVSMLNSISQ